MKSTLDQLVEEVRALTDRVSDIEQRVSETAVKAVPEIAAPGMSAVEKEATVDTIRSAEKETVHPDERRASLSMGGMAAIFSRFTAVSIILLLALVLRTLTDNGMLGLAVGSILGIIYASLLEGTGFILYRRRNPFAPIFSVSGALLLFAVVWETQAVFGSISSLTAYTMLIVAGGGMAVMSHIYKVAIPVWIGTIGVLAAGVPIDFPDPNFLYLSILLIAVNIMAFSAVNLPRSWWLRIAAFISTTFIFMAWGYKLYVSVKSEDTAGQLFYTGWFLPILTVMAAFYVGSVFWHIMRAEHHKPDLFDSVLPALTVTWAYWLARLTLPSTHKALVMVGSFGTLIAVILLVMAFFIARYRKDGAPGTNTLVFPGAILLAISFRDLSGESVIALSVLSLAAFGLIFLSIKWQSPGVRVTSYFLQAIVIGASFILLLNDPAGASSPITIGAMASIAVVAFFQYRRIRAIDPPHPSIFFSRIDRKDRSGVIPFLVALAAGFLTLRALSFIILSGAGFQSSLSVIINLGAALLFLKAYRMRNSEVRNVALFVMLLGAGKVFFFDLLRVKGMPVVMSVLSFGIAAALGSILLGKWHRLEKG